MPDPREKDAKRGMEAREGMKTGEDTEAKETADDQVQQAIEQRASGREVDFREDYREDFLNEGYEPGAPVGVRQAEEFGDDEDFVDAEMMTSREDFDMVNPDVEIGQEPNRE